MSPNIVPEHFAIIGAVIFLSGLWGLLALRLLEALRNRRDLLRYKLHPPYENQKELRIGLYARLCGTILLLIGSFALIILVLLPWRHSAQAPGTGNSPLVTLSIESNAPASPPTDYSIAIAGVALLLAGGTLLFLGVQSRRATTAFAGSLLLLTGLTSTIKNELKLDNHFDFAGTITAGPPAPHPVFETVGGVAGFPLGCADYPATYCKLPKLKPSPQPPNLLCTLRGETKSCPGDLFNAICQQTGTFFIVGYTDRVPLSAQSRLRFESNVGLAQARAESIREAILDSCPSDQTKRPTLFTQVGGPRHTPELSSNGDPFRGHERDRNVEVIWFHDATSDLASGGAAGKENSDHGWLRPLVVLLIILTLALLMAFGATWSVSYNFAERKLEIERKREPAKMKPDHPEES